MEEEITEKEHTWLSLKYGNDYLYHLGRMGQPVAHGGAGKKFTGAEAKAARLGLTVVKERELALIKEMEENIADQIRKEIDAELLKTITELSSGS